MQIDVLPIGLYQENIYILHDHDQAVVIDPGGHADIIKKAISASEKLAGVLLTHGHEDHTLACDELLDMFADTPVYIHPDDKPLIDPDAPFKNGYNGTVYHPTLDLSAGEHDIGPFHFTVYHTPGHTPGSVCILYRNVLFSGDTLFAGSIGRTDLEGGDEDKILKSVLFLSKLHADLRVLPGHGPETTIGHELKMNPFIVYMNK